MGRSAFLLISLGLAVGCGNLETEPTASLAAQALTHSECQSQVTEDHFVRVAGAATLHVVERRAVDARSRRGGGRALLMLPATLVTSILWNADVPGHPEYNALAVAAEHGYTAYTLDYLGYGLSSRPADGKTVTAQRLLADAADVVRWIRARHPGTEIDLLGSSLGSTLALILGSKNSPIPRGWLGRIVLTANVYRNVTPLAAEGFLNPATEAFFSSLPGGYVDTVANNYGLVLYAAEPAAQNYCYQNCPGSYAVGPTLEAFHLPIADAALGRVPMLQFWGDADLVTPRSDAEQLQAEYGGPHRLVTLAGGGHVPHWEAVRGRFWRETFAFLDQNGHSGRDNRGMDHVAAR